MNENFQFATAFLQDLDAHQLEELSKRREAWSMDARDFRDRLDAWFSNFQESDRALALKLLLKLRYFSKSDFGRAVDNQYSQIAQYLSKTGSTERDLRLVLPSDLGDSAGYHAYQLRKDWGLGDDQLITVDQLEGEEPRCILVFFNDTHGTGNQFLREVFSKVSKDKFKAIFVVALTIAERALLRFKREMEGVRVLPEAATPSVFDQFTYREVNRLRELGSQVYSKHPFGYGGAGLLVAYWFQCPNNTLPLIWADSKAGNNQVDGKAFHWKPLFPYKPKPATTEPPVVNAPKLASPDPSLLDCDGVWSTNELQQIIEHIASWGLTNAAFYETVGLWFRNFKVGERDAARTIFLATTYLDIAAIRSAICSLGKELMAKLNRVGGDMGDVILVTTGDEKNSVYHYMFEFMRQWHLSVDQVQSLERLTPDRVIDKTLVFFYHTRPSGKHFENHHAERLARLTPRANVFAAYAMTNDAKIRFSKLRVASPSDVCTEVASRTVDSLDAGVVDVVSRIEQELNPLAKPSDPSNTFLIAYYFQCPKDTSRLLWHEQKGTEQQRPWMPLFRHIVMPSNATLDDRQQVLPTK